MLVMSGSRDSILARGATTPRGRINVQSLADPSGLLKGFPAIIGTMYALTTKKGETGIEGVTWEQIADTVPLQNVGRLIVMDDVAAAIKLDEVLELFQQLAKDIQENPKAYRTNAVKFVENFLKIVKDAPVATETWPVVYDEIIEYREHVPMKKDERGSDWRSAVEAAEKIPFWANTINLGNIGKVRDLA